MTAWPAENAGRIFVLRSIAFKKLLAHGIIAHRATLEHLNADYLD
jgi:hypothetical protein